LVDHRAVSAVASITKGAQQQRDFVAADDVWQRFVAADLDLFPDVPVVAEMIAVEGAQGALRLVDGAARSLEIIVEVDEVVRTSSLPRLTMSVSG
jgi:hypothetical protein